MSILEGLTNLLEGHLSDGEQEELLLTLTPDQVSPELLKTCLGLLQAQALPVPKLSVPVLDCCGTGGSGVAHYNTSTTVAFVLAAGGVPVVKFGNRAATSQSGSFDFLGALGIPSEFPREATPQLLAEGNLAFAFAPQYYPGLAPLTAARQRIGVKTIFNFLGPLLNPFRPAYRILGVSHPQMHRWMANHLKETSYNQRSLLVCSPIYEGCFLDELHPCGDSHLLQVESNQIKDWTLKSHFPGGYDFSTAPPLSPQDNADIFHQLVKREDSTSIYHHMVCLNAGAGFYAAGKVGSIEAGQQLAKTLLLQGEVEQTYQTTRRLYASFS